MNFKDFYRVLEGNKYPVFSYEDLLVFFPREKKASIARTLSRWGKKSWIYSLKRGLYELTYPRDLNVPDLFIANKLYTPSYVSLETALSHYSIIPEMSIAVTSITSKPTRTFRNKHGLFNYRTVKPASFTGYYTEKYGNFEVLIAEPEKALIDFIYFKTYRNRKFNLADERLDKKITSRLDRKKLVKYSKSYSLNLKGFYAYL